MKKICFISMLVLLIALFGVMVKAENLQVKMTKEALKINHAKVNNHRQLNKKDQIDYIEAMARVSWLEYWSRHLNESNIHHRRIWKDLFSIVAYESSFVNWKDVDGDQGFGWGSLHYDTCKFMARIYNFDWQKDQKIIEGNNKLQAKYITAWYLYLLEQYNNDRSKAITGYKFGVNVQKPENHNYYWVIYGRISHYAKEW